MFSEQPEKEKHSITSHCLEISSRLETSESLLSPASSSSSPTSRRRRRRQLHRSTTLGSNRRPLRLAIMMVDDDSLDISIASLPLEGDSALTGLDSVKGEGEEVDGRVEDEEEDDSAHDCGGFRAFEKEGDEEVEGRDGPDWKNMTDETGERSEERR
jgi:hypothetical protein